MFADNVASLYTSDEFADVSSNETFLHELRQQKSQIMEHCFLQFLRSQSERYPLEQLQKIIVYLMEEEVEWQLASKVNIDSIHTVGDLDPFPTMFAPETRL